MFPDECIVTQNSPRSDKKDKTHLTISAAYAEPENVKCEYIGWDQKKIPGWRKQSLMDSKMRRMEE